MGSNREKVLCEIQEMFGLGKKATYEVLDLWFLGGLLIVCF